ncbi:DUF547 domain-containing protein [Arcticibacterium luteifluviistationis]|uniref:DUF547 domain-containing protein n=1 Tax=Arcticibacterium luteifluviistationis TaxID=1784714 RepID=A0A2Z4G9I1_9BACT|nr:DUF547 domain-containing protein [Arcticibacterium luteifluviistationis]AWV97583.1 DUF547 domain-containing protein [Arcticibacterium luteifluviistationis]
MTINNLAEDLLLKVKKGEDTEALENEIAGLSLEQLKSELNNDILKKAFWINCYNAYYQILRKRTQLIAPEVYTEKAIKVAGESFSLDEMEHGILRKYRIKISLGYLPNIFAAPLIKSLAVAKIDYRIHFALNCGAKSCPPIAFYKTDSLEQQLDMATLSLLEGETEVFYDRMEIHTTSLMSWYRGDFNGEKGVKAILEEKLEIPTKGFKMIYKPYSWEDDLHDFI